MMRYGFAGAVLAPIVIFLYDGTRGNFKGVVAKYSFYTFYPIHLYVLKFIYFLMQCEIYYSVNSAKVTELIKDINGCIFVQKFLNRY